MTHSMRFLLRRAVLGVADYAVTIPVVRWTWTGPSNDTLLGGLSEFRPSDRESILEMREGRFLLASKLIDTQGGSPFDVETNHADWLDDLHAFGWLRHFRDARTEEERRFARELTLDWIDREGQFSRESWTMSLTARRVLNWLRHYSVLFEGANSDEQQVISRSLSTQIQSLRLRSTLASDPVDALLASLALLGVALCSETRESDIAAKLRPVHRLLNQQIDEDGLHRTRNAKVQVMLMVELITLNQALRSHHQAFANEFNSVLENMHRALDAVSLGTGDPAYFNGTGQMPHDLVVAVQAQSPTRARTTGSTGGYGRLVSSRSIVVADSGQVPSPEYAQYGHASALAFEFSHGRDLIVCNCGPAPAGLEGDPLLFRQGIAHSCPTINAISSAAIPAAGPLAGRLVEVSGPAELEAQPADQSLVIRTHGYEDRFGVVLERHLTLLAEGKTLVGQDRFVPIRSNRISGACAIRFHLAPQTDVQVTEDLVRLRLGSGAIWTFLWEGAEMRVEDSIRQSAYFGFHRTRQIVLEALPADSTEVSWIFTLEES